MVLFMCVDQFKHLLVQIAVNDNRFSNELSFHSIVLSNDLRIDAESCYFFFSIHPHSIHSRFDFPLHFSKRFQVSIRFFVQIQLARNIAAQFTIHNSHKIKHWTFYK